MEKMTKAQMFEMVRDIVVESGAEDTAELVAFIDHEVELLAAKAVKAQERAAAKKAEGDALRAVVESVLTDELQLIDTIVAQIEGEGITKQKVTARLSQLAKLGHAVKEAVKTEDGRKVMAYRLPMEGEVVEVADAE